MREERGKVRLSFRNRLVLLVTYLSLPLICSENFNFSSSNEFWGRFCLLGDY